MLFLKGYLLIKYFAEGSIVPSMKAAVQIIEVGFLSFGLAIVYVDTEQIRVLKISPGAIFSFLYLTL